MLSGMYMYTVSIVVESCQLGVNPGDVHQCTALFEGLAEAGTLISFNSVPCYTPTFLCEGSCLQWEVQRAEPATVAEDSSFAAPEPEPEEEKEGTEGQKEEDGEEGGESLLPRVGGIRCVARLLQVGEWRFGARGFPLATVIELDGVGLARDAWRLERQQRESLYALQAYTAQLDAYVGGGGDWAADGLDDDEYLDAPGAWHDGEALGDFLGA